MLLPLVNIQHLRLSHPGDHVGVEVAGPELAVDPLLVLGHHAQPESLLASDGEHSDRAIHPAKPRLASQNKTELRPGPLKVLEHPFAELGVGVGKVLDHCYSSVT